MLAPHLGPDLLPEALTIAETLNNVGLRLKTRIALVTCLHSPNRHQVLSDTVEAANAISDDRVRAGALATLVAQLSSVEKQQVLSAALAAATALWKQDGDGTALAALAPNGAVVRSVEIVLRRSPAV
jgi:hypothetical protein